MYNFGGFTSNIAANCGLLFTIGILCILMSHVGKENFNKETFFAGIGSILLGICIGADLWMNMSSPTIKTYQGVLYAYEANASVSSPMAEGNCYTFGNGIEPLMSFYLDGGTMNEMLPGGFEPDQEYVIYYEEHEKIIVRIEEAGENKQAVSP